MEKCLINCRIYTESEQLVHLAIENGNIRAVCRNIPDNAEILADAKSRIVIPGLIDTHIHGAGGGDLSDGTEQSFHTAAETLCRLGTTSFYATTFYRPGGENRHLQILAKTETGSREADCRGIHLEGPFINPVKKGGIPPEYIARPDPAVFQDIKNKCGAKPLILTCAPELPGMEEILAECKESAVRASLGHSDADTEEAREGFEQGIGLVTHLGNAMRPFHHREPGPLPAILGSAAFVQIISDGVHLHPDAVKFYYDIFGADRCICITDGIECTGLPDGEYRFRGKPYKSENGAAFYSDGSGLIGTSLGLYEIMLRYKRFTGCSLQDAVAAASTNPARCMGIDDRKGFIKPGCDADLLLIDEDLKLHTVIKNGRLV
ncbi:MAG: N-acetylglucosamine-6-phosphate deacetylase [Candidatus Marinimicrobia bacterium]|nr:N-acetylglucosamine-6-phosphate deacetylase [Candidatus Neomarinimicrobiota bacterium]